MKALVTGATGFVGSAVARALIGAGWDVRVLVRAGNGAGNLDALDAECAPGDLLDADSLRNAVRGCDALFHVAADYRLWVPDPDVMYGINVHGTRNLMLAALDAGVKKIVHTSSVATLKLNRSKVPVDETSRAEPEDMVGHYKRSKLLGEAEVLHLVKTRGLPAVVVSPSTPIGPFDVRPTPTGRVIVDALKGRMPAYVDTGLNVAHVDDVAAGHLLAWEKGRVGEVYILGGEDMSLKTVLETIADISGGRPPKVRLPAALLMPFAYMVEAYARMAGLKNLQLTVDGLKMARKHMYFSSAKAESELGYTSRTAREALADAVEWFRANSYC